MLRVLQGARDVLSVVVQTLKYTGGKSLVLATEISKTAVGFIRSNSLEELCMD
jgi:hypothetical protein